jgi:hypothetical protein
VTAKLFQSSGEGNKGVAVSAEANLLFEAILTPKQLLMHRFAPEQARSAIFHYIPDPAKLMRQPLAPLPLSVEGGERGVGRRPIRLSFVGQLKMDGQKTIWLQQMKLLDRRRFVMRYISFSDPDDLPDKGSAMASKLVQLLVPVTIMPLSVANEELYKDPDLLAKVQAAVAGGAPGGGGGSGICPYLLGVLREAHLGPSSGRGEGAEEEMMEYDVRKLDAVEPQWVRAVWYTLVNTLRDSGGMGTPDVLVFANARDPSDRVLVAAARMAGVALVIMELPNLFPMKGLVSKRYVYW